jgi:hypothetical protein
MNGYVTYVNNNPKYQLLSDILIESILSFSKYDIHVFCINHNKNHSSSRVHFTNVSLSEETFFSICNIKPLAAIESIFDCGIILDSDVIITSDLDNLFDEVDNDLLDVPIAPIHPDDVSINQEFLNFLGVKSKTQHYVHADTYIFNKKSTGFLEECYKVGLDCISKNIIPSVVDETIFNALLWKQEKTNAYNYVYDPFYECFLDFNISNLNKHGYDTSKPIKKYICHGCKDPIQAKQIYDNLLKEKM